MQLTSHNSNVAVVSLNQRGAWLASSLVDLGLNVDFIDVNFKRKSLAYDELEGPFGGYTGEGLSQSFVEQMQFEEPFIQLENGLVVWGPEAPIEERSAYFQNQIQVNGSYIQRFFSHFASTRSEYIVDMKSSGTPEQARFAIRDYSRDSAERFKSRLNEKVYYASGADILDLSFLPKNQIALELDGDYRGLKTYEHVIWCLSSHETKYYFPKVKERYSFIKEKDIDYYWIPFFVRFEKGPEYYALPPHFVLVEDAQLLRESHNVHIAKKSMIDSVYQIWSLVPASQVQRDGFIKGYAEELVKILEKRAPRLKPQIHSYSHQIETEEPLFFPVYKKESIGEFSHKNLFFHSPDVWTSFLWQEQFANQKNILTKIENFETKKRKSQ